MNEREQATTYLDTLFSQAVGFLELRCLPANGEHSLVRQFIPAQERSRLLDSALSLANTHNVYVGVAPRNARSGDKEAVKSAWALWADVDSGQAVYELGRFTPPPSLTIKSGSGQNRHAYWLLVEPIGADELEDANRRLAAKLGADKCWDAPHILRIPGTVNHKNEQPVVLDRCEASSRYELSEVLENCPSVEQISVSDEVRVPAELGSDIQEKLTGKAREIFVTIGDDRVEDRSKELARLAYHVRLQGNIAPPECYAILSDAAERSGKFEKHRDVSRARELWKMVDAAWEHVAATRMIEDDITLIVETGQELCALPDPPEEDQLLGPLVLRRQRLVVGGHTGEGKTTFCLQLIRAILRKEFFLDQWQGRGGRALVIDAEQGLKTIKRRLREADLDVSSLDYIRVPDGLSLDEQTQHVKELERVFAENGPYDVVLADPLYKLHRGDSNDERAATDLMRRFDAWREHYGFALILPTHCRKPNIGTQFSIHELFGSSAFLRGAEVVVGLRRISDGAAQLHWFKDRDGDLPIGAKWQLLFNREGGFKRDPNEKRETAFEAIVEFFVNQPEATEWSARRLAEQQLGFSKSTIHRHLKQAREVALEQLKTWEEPRAQELSWE